MPIRVEETAGAPLFIGLSEVSALCQALIHGDLTPPELAYVSDVIQLAENVEYSDDRVSDFIFQMSDPETNGPFTIESAKSVMAQLSKHEAG